MRVGFWAFAALAARRRDRPLWFWPAVLAFYLYDVLVLNWIVGTVVFRAPPVPWQTLSQRVQRLVDRGDERAFDVARMLNAVFPKHIKRVP